MSPSIRPPVGAVLGAAVSVAIAIWEGGRLMNDTGVLVGDSVGLTGLPIAALLGWRFADRVGRWSPVGLALWMGTSAVLLGDVMVSIGIVVLNLLEGNAMMAAALPYLLSVGILFGAVVLPIAVAGAIAWLGAFWTLDWIVDRLQAKGPGSTGASGAGGKYRPSGSRRPWRGSHRC